MSLLFHENPKTRQVQGILQVVVRGRSNNKKIIKNTETLEYCVTSIARNADRSKKQLTTNIIPRTKQTTQQY